MLLSVWVYCYWCIVVGMSLIVWVYRTCDPSPAIASTERALASCKRPRIRSSVTLTEPTPTPTPEPAPDATPAPAPDPEPLLSSSYPCGGCCSANTQSRAFSAAIRAL